MANKRNYLKDVLPPGAREPCPICHSSTLVIPLISMFYCNNCERAFTTLEARQDKIIIRLKAVIKDLQKQVKRVA